MTSTRSTCADNESAQVAEGLGSHFRIELVMTASHLHPQLI